MATLFIVAGYTTPCKFQNVCFFLPYFYVGDHMQFAVSLCHKKNWPLFWPIFYIEFFKSIGAVRGMRQCKSHSVVVLTVTRVHCKLCSFSDIARPLLYHPL